MAATRWISRGAVSLRTVPELLVGTRFGAGAPAAAGVRVERQEPGRTQIKRHAWLAAVGAETNGGNAGKFQVRGNSCRASEFVGRGINLTAQTHKRNMSKSAQSASIIETSIDAEISGTDRERSDPDSKAEGKKGGYMAPKGQLPDINVPKPDLKVWMDPDIPMAIFQDVQILKQRGFFEFTFFPDRFRIYTRKQTIDLEIPYSDVKGIIGFPSIKTGHLDRVRVFISLKKSIKMRGQLYNYLIPCFVVHRKLSVKMLNVKAEELVANYGSHLPKVIQGSWWAVFTSVMKHMIWKDAELPKSVYCMDPVKPVAAVMRKNEGHLYFCEACFIWVKKPPLIIWFEDIEVVNFLLNKPVNKPGSLLAKKPRMKGGLTMIVTLKDSTEWEFFDILVTETKRLQNHLARRGVEVIPVREDQIAGTKKSKQKKKNKTVGEGDEMSSDSDSDYFSSDSESDDTESEQYAIDASSLQQPLKKSRGDEENLSFAELARRVPREP
ncbi:FACT complex subunit SSRP1 [Porphyridium purpureum]|uniref:FACT complex subunit SSRP1 n=1 Tax=Porphyridium purpureum TaxID=35688 RepID=A0A5J4Z3Y0_PORPP|nr:FACT complex subunit SSRP1 [Porphyridium purpureum]|eukprot:POR7564..scf295_1